MLRLALVVVLGISAFSLRAEGGFPAPSDLPILQITHGGESHALDAAGIRILPAESFTTTTIWTDGPQTFTGVRMTELLGRLGITEGRIDLTAANGYRITVDVAEFEPNGALVAYERNGRAMTLRDKGPLWLVYPYDADPAYRTEVIYANSIWQLDRIDIAQ